MPRQLRPRWVSSLVRRRQPGVHLQVVMDVLASGNRGRSGAARSSVGIDRGERFERIENQTAAFAAEDFFVVVILCQKLQNMWKNAKAAAFALTVFDLSERVTVVALRDPVVKGEQAFRYRRDGLFAPGYRGGEFLFLCAVLQFDFFAVAGDGFFSFFQIGVGVAKASVDFFAAHHEFELAVFGLGDFGFRVGDFVLKSFVGFVGFDRAALIAIFARAFLPLLDVELEFLALFERV